MTPSEAETKLLAACREAVGAIVDDLSGRSGLGNALDECDSGVQREIRETWTRLLLSRLSRLEQSRVERTVGQLEVLRRYWASPMRVFGATCPEALRLLGRQAAIVAEQFSGVLAILTAQDSSAGSPLTGHVYSAKFIPEALSVEQVEARGKMLTDDEPPPAEPSPRIELLDVPINDHKPTLNPPAEVKPSEEELSQSDTAIHVVTLRRRDGAEVPTTWGLDCDEMGDFPGDAAAAEEGLQRARDRYPDMEFRIVRYDRIEKPPGRQSPTEVKPSERLEALMRGSCDASMVAAVRVVGAYLDEQHARGRK